MAFLRCERTAQTDMIVLDEPRKLCVVVLRCRNGYMHVLLSCVVFLQTLMVGPSPGQGKKFDTRNPVHALSNPTTSSNMGEKSNY